MVIYTTASHFSLLADTALYIVNIDFSSFSVVNRPRRNSHWPHTIATCSAVKQTASRVRVGETAENPIFSRELEIQSYVAVSVWGKRGFLPGSLQTARNFMNATMYREAGARRGLHFNPECPHSVLN